MKNYILETLLEEKNNNLKGMLYHNLQIKFAYNSNHIEGSTLTEDQTRHIFETNSFFAENETVKVKDVIETLNHFKCFDFIIEHANEKLSEKYIKKLHFLLKSNTSDSQIEWFKVGEYKQKPNTVGGNRTANPKQVEAKMKKLLENYNSQTEITVEKIIDFHYKFEKIHPFQDGNGRLGRLWHTLILSKWKEFFAWLPIETLIQKRQQKYYEAINLSNNIGKSTPFVTFILEIIKETLEELQKNDLKMTDILTDKMTDKELQRLKILEEYFEKNNYIDNSEAQKILNVSDSTVRRFFNKLLKNGILEAIGENKGRKYRKINKI